MDEHWLWVVVVVDVSDATQEVEHGGGVPRDAKIRPGDVVELVDLSNLLWVNLNTDKIVCDLESEEGYS